MTNVNEDFSRYGRKQASPTPIGACQRFATFLGNNPSASVNGIEESADGKDLDIVIGVGSKTLARVSADFLISTKVWAEQCAREQIPQIQGIIDRSATLLGNGSPIVLVRPYGSLDLSGGIR